MPGSSPWPCDKRLDHARSGRKTRARSAWQGFRWRCQVGGGGDTTALRLLNVLRVSGGLFLECVRQVAEGYPDVAYEEQLIDAMAALLIRDPSPYDVIVTTNMSGDILSDEASRLSGSLRLATSLNAGAGHGAAQHGSAPGIAGQDVANPASLIGSAAMLLAWLGERRGEGALLRATGLIEAALDRVVAMPGYRTWDLGGLLGTRAFAARVMEALGG